MIKQTKIFKEVQAEHELLDFFSSFLKDVLHVVTNIKRLVYDVIGVQVPMVKMMKVSSEIYSIMNACNQGYQDMRRVETLLKGHLKGKASQIFGLQPFETFGSKDTQIGRNRQLLNRQYPNSLNNNALIGYSKSNQTQYQSQFEQNHHYLVGKHVQNHLNKIGVQKLPLKQNGISEKTKKQNKEQREQICILEDQFSQVKSLALIKKIKMELRLTPFQ